MSESQRRALDARREACAMRVGNPLRYMAWRRVSYFEQQLTDDEYDDYRARINRGSP